MPARGQRLVNKFRGAVRQRLQNTKHYLDVINRMHVKHPDWKLIDGVDEAAAFNGTRTLIRDRLEQKIRV